MAKNKKLTGYNWFQILSPIVLFALIGVSSVVWGGIFSKEGAVILFFIGCVMSKIEYIKIVNNLKDITILKYRK